MKRERENSKDMRERGRERKYDRANPERDEGKCSLSFLCDWKSEIDFIF